MQAAYAALSSVLTLQGVVIRAYTLKDRGAALVSSLEQPCCVQVRIKNLGVMLGSAFQTLSRGRAKMTVVHVVHVRIFQCQQLQSMHDLKFLALIHPIFESATNLLHVQPAVTHLQYVADKSTNHLGIYDAIPYDLNKFPALQKLNGTVHCRS